MPQTDTQTRQSYNSLLFGQGLKTNGCKGLLYLSTKIKHHNSDIKIYIIGNILDSTTILTAWDARAARMAHYDTIILCKQDINQSLNNRTLFQKGTWHFIRKLGKVFFILFWKNRTSCFIEYPPFFRLEAFFVVLYQLVAGKQVRQKLTWRENVRAVPFTCDFCASAIYVLVVCRLLYACCDFILQRRYNSVKGSFFLNFFVFCLRWRQAGVYTPTQFVVIYRVPNHAHKFNTALIAVYHNHYQAIHGLPGEAVTIAFKLTLVKYL